MARIRIVGGVADGKVWEGNDPPMTMERIGYVPMGSVHDYGKNAPPVVDALITRSYYVLRTLSAGTPDDLYYVYADSQLTVSQLMELLLQNYCSLDSRIK